MENCSLRSKRDKFRHRSVPKLAKFDSCSFSKTSRYFKFSLNLKKIINLFFLRWKLVKHCLDFIKRSKLLARRHQIQMKDILTLELRNEILRTQGEEFDLYLKGLTFRDFSNEATKLYWWLTDWHIIYIISFIIS